MNWLERLTLALYSCAVWSMQPLVRIKLWRRSLREPEYGIRVNERFGHYGDMHSKGWLWVHAVSLGETRAAGVLIAQLRTLRPGLKLLLTHGTASGWIAGRSILKPGDRQEWFPWDTKGATERFLNHFRPAAGLMMETEVWPNMVHACLRHGTPLILVNARKSQRSFAAARRKRWLAEPAYRSLTAVIAQGSADETKLAALGAKVVGVFGNVKFDAEPTPEQLVQGKAWRRLSCRPVLMLASSRDGEEAALIDALSSRQGSRSRVSPSALGRQILVVPRHTQRAEELADKFRSAGFTVSCRSQWRDKPLDADVWLGDTMGELPLYYAMSDVALLGGSFERFGGQNLIEAAACGCPIVLGPHTFNFDEAARWALSAGAARRASDIRNAVDQAIDWMERTEDLTAARRHCLEFAGAHHGAARHTAEAIFALLAPPSNGSTAARSTGYARPDPDLNARVNMPVAHQMGAS